MADSITPDKATTTTKMATVKYRLKPLLAAQYPQMTSLVPVNLNEKVGGKTEVIAVALSGIDFTKDIAATATRPAYKKTIKGATQDQLRYLKEVEGNVNIEKFEE